MIKRELIRITLIGVLGLVIALYMYFTGEINKQYYILLSPFYTVGLVYGAKAIFKMMFATSKAYLAGQITSLFSHPIWGTLICIMIFAFVIKLILRYGWILGWLNCFIILKQDYDEDKKSRLAQSEQRWQI